MNKSVAVIFGGVSNENEISVITGTMAANVLKSGGDSVIPLYVSQRGEMYTGENLADINNFKNGKYSSFPRASVGKNCICVLNKRGKVKKILKVDVALNCCHGGLGEGGGVCGLFALNGIPLASAGMFESAAFLDKYFTKLVLRSLYVPVAPYVYIRKEEDAPTAEKLGYPMIVKPARLGSSIGISRVDNEEQLKEAVAAAFVYDGGVIAEKYFSDRREINCAAYYANGAVVTSECEEAISDGEILSYDDKYAGGGKSVMPADIPPALSRRIKRITAKVYSRLNMRGIVRFDYIISEGKLYLSEINTVPGSLSYYLLSNGFKDFYPVLQAVIVQALEDFKASGEKRVLDTGILNNLPSNACKSKGK
ncbi:MAG: ATP-grasp domain-containing protein [Clostridia bacterium]|nr:ATP-grasp domain-containing protein [Clostridia bacterium]